MDKYDFTEEQVREYLLKIKPFINLSYVCSYLKENGLSTLDRPVVSNFIAGNTKYVSLKKMQQFIYAVDNHIIKNRLSISKVDILEKNDALVSKYKDILTSIKTIIPEEL